MLDSTIYLSVSFYSKCQKSNLCAFIYSDWEYEGVSTGLGNLFQRWF